MPIQEKRCPVTAAAAASGHHYGGQSICGSLKTG